MPEAQEEIGKRGPPLHSVVPDDPGNPELLACGEEVHQFVFIDIDGGQLGMETIDVDSRVIDSMDVLKDTGSPNMKSQ